MVHFVRCSIDGMKHKEYYRTNDPININIVRSVCKSREKYYPDNEGYPSIDFIFAHQDHITWVYEKEQEKIRDNDFQRITQTHDDLYYGMTKEEWLRTRG